MSKEQDNKRISDLYREAASEATPARLDEQVLAMAAQEARSRYGVARAWVRPVAWAATIGISLAFMLELTWFADTPTGVPAPAVSEERARQDAEVMKAKREEGLNRAIAEQAEAPPAAAPAAEAASLLRAAEEQARDQAESAQTDAMVSSTATDDRDHACDASARATADSWYACILALREEGRNEDAADELETLLQVFPDFREPAPE